MSDDEIFSIRDIIKNHSKDTEDEKRDLMRYYVILIDS